MSPGDVPEEGRSALARVIANLGSAVAVRLDDELVTSHAFPVNELPLLVAGDRVRVRVDPHAVRVVELLPRDSVLEKISRHSRKPLAANLTHLGIVCADPPGIDTLLIDQFTLAARQANVSAMVIFNKQDRLCPEERELVDQLTALYQAIGYSAVLIDTRSDEGIEPLIRQMVDRTIVLVGASGAGKSSIIRRLLPDKDVRVGEVSKNTGLGKHTTSVTHWYDLPSGGAVIDSPGVRQYSVSHLDATAVRQGFLEILRFATDCRFADCSHRVEPDCAVKKALAQGHVGQSRYDNYLRLLEQ